MSTPEQPTLDQLEQQGPIAGPTVMTRANREGLRKAVAKAKSWFKPGVSAETAIKAAVVVYLNEWAKTYGQGVQASHLTSTERTILSIRQDTVQQILRELA